MPPLHCILHKGHLLHDIRALDVLNLDKTSVQTGTKCFSTGNNNISLVSTSEVSKIGEEEEEEQYVGNVR